MTLPKSESLLTGWPAILGYTGEICHTGIMLGFMTFEAPYWEIMGFSEIAAVATNIYTGWRLFSLLKFEEPFCISSNSSYLAYIARFEEISSGLLKLTENVQ